LWLRPERISQEYHDSNMKLSTGDAGVENFTGWRASMEKTGAGAY
jgi:hypothetical protein